VEDLVQFLRDRLDEDEATARAAASAERADTWTAIPDSYGGVLDGTGSRSLVVGYGDVMAPGTAAHIARHDPARVLAEVEAKRRIIDDVVPQIDGMEDRIDSEWGAGDPTERESATLFRLLALPYADHPDYREEWRP